MHLIQIYNMHGPTVWWTDDWKELDNLIYELDRLNDPRSNAGPYRLIITIDDHKYELIPVV